MKNSECIAMILAGGNGNRLGTLTKDVPKPAITFGGGYRLIDFTLSNCVNSNISTIGVLIQYKHLALSRYIGTGAPWNNIGENTEITMLPPRGKKELYRGTADAILKNIDFIDQYNPENVLILSGDHVYKMHYEEMIKAHKASGAAATIAALEVPWHDASRFGIINSDEHNNIVDFEEKPWYPKSNLASMGIYIFNWKILKKYLYLNSNDPVSSMDFGKNIIPDMLSVDEKMCVYKFNGYWKDVGTVQSLWEASMDLLASPPSINFYDNDWKITSGDPFMTHYFVSKSSDIKNSFITDECEIYGTVNGSIISAGIQIGIDSVIVDSIIMPGAKIGNGAVVYKSIIGYDAVIGNDAVIGANLNYYTTPFSEPDQKGVAVIGNGVNIGSQVKIPSNCIVVDNIDKSLESRVINLNIKELPYEKMQKIDKINSTVLQFDEHLYKE